MLVAIRPEVSPRAPEDCRQKCEVVRKVEVEVEPTQTTFPSAGGWPEVLKLNLKGRELAIIRGSRPILAEINVIEIEVSFVATYANQPLNQEVLDFMVDNGFIMPHIAAFDSVGAGSAIQANVLFGNRRKPGDRQATTEDIVLGVMDAGHVPLEPVRVDMSAQRPRTCASCRAVKSLKSHV